MAKSNGVDELDAHLAAQVQAHRARLRLSSRQMDEVLGGSIGITSRIERGEKRLDTKTMHRLATYLNVPVDAFFVGVPKTDVFPVDTTLSEVPISEVSAFISAYRSIKSTDARRKILALVRTVGESPHYSSAEDTPKDIKKMNAS